MKRYEIQLEMASGNTKIIEVEGMTEGDAMRNLTDNGRFVKDLKTKKLVNKDKVECVEFLKEVAFGATKA